MVLQLYSSRNNGLQWTTIGKEVMAVILKILNEKGDLNGCNETFITLIPKVHDPKVPKDFCLVSLCNTC